MGSLRISVNYYFEICFCFCGDYFNYFELAFALGPFWLPTAKLLLSYLPVTRNKSNFLDYSDILLRA